MAQESTLHHWINTAIAAIAMAVSGVSLYFANTANNLAEEQAAQNRENIGVSATSILSTCPWSISQPTGELGLCWKVDLWNRSIQPSEIKTMEVSYSTNDDQQRVLTLEPTILSLTITRTGKSPIKRKPPIHKYEVEIPGRNEAIMIIQAMLPYSAHIKDIVSAFIQEHHDNITQQELAVYLYDRKKHVDILGNKVNFGMIDDPSGGAPQLSIVTSLNKSFGTELEVPNGDTGNFTADNPNDLR